MMKNIDRIKSRILPSLSAALFLTVTVFVLAPLEIVSLNKNDFDFSVSDFWYVTIVFALITTLIMAVILTILPDRFSRICTTLTMALALCLYIQAMFLNGALESFQGQRNTFSVSDTVINTFIWIIVFAAALCGMHFVRDKWPTVICFISAFFFLIQLVASISLIAGSYNDPEDEREYFATAEGMFDVAPDENVFFFISDTFDGRVMDSILEDDPDFLEPFRGFTYYPNCTSTYSRTFPSVHYLLTEQMYWFDHPAWEYLLNDSWTDSEYFKSMVDKGVSIGIYTDTGNVGNETAPYVINYTTDKYDIDKRQLIMLTTKMALYRDMPYLFKNRFHYDSTEINGRIYSESEDQPEMLTMWYDDRFDGWMDESGINIDRSMRNGAFRFYHFGGYHISMEQEPAVESINMIKRFCERLKEQGLYESSTIIITADHGFSGAGYPEYMPHKTAVPLMLVKPAGTDDGEELKICDAPVEHKDLFATVRKAYGIDSGGQPAIYEIPEDAERERYYYHSALPKDTIGEIELREFRITGDARLPESYVYTGNSWDIQYSANKICEDKGKYQ